MFVITVRVFFGLALNRCVTVDWNTLIHSDTVLFNDDALTVNIAGCITITVTLWP